MTKKLSDCTPEEAARVRSQVQAYKLRNLDRIKEQSAKRHAWRYANDPAYRERKDRQANEANLRRKYGIGSAERDARLTSQGNVCKVCKTPTPGGRGWHIDHCHTTGIVRGILCTACNVFIGRIEARPEIHQAALDYIASFK